MSDARVDWRLLEQRCRDAAGANISDAELAERMRCSLRTLQRRRAGQSEPSLSAALKIRDAFGVGLDELFPSGRAAA